MKPRELSTSPRRRSRPALLLVTAALASFGAAGVAPLEAQTGSNWVAPERRAQRANPLDATAENITRGRDVYVRECASCHGAAGNNDGDKAPKELADSRRLSDPSLLQESDGALFWKIGEGRRPMPATWDVLSDRERWQVVLYIRTFTPAPAVRTGQGGAP
jgi:mono/diheme cytochrome c family protein